MTFDELIEYNNRTSPGTYIGSDGLLKTTTITSKNLLTWTEDYTNSGWVKGGTTVTANTATYGTMTADTITATGSTTHVVSRGSTVNFVSGVTYAISIYADAGTSSFLQIQGTSTPFGANAFANFDLANGTVGTVGSSATASIELDTNGMYRCKLIITAIANGSGLQFLMVTSATAVRNESWVAIGTETILLGGSQVEIGSTVTSYEKNVGWLFPPRFTYDPVTLQPRGLLVEDTRINRTLHSNDFTNAVWTNTIPGTSTRVNSNNSLGFMRGLITATSAGGGIRQVHSGLTTGISYALSFYIESAATSVLVLFENGAATFGSAHSVTINPSNGTAGALTGFTSVRIVPFGPGYIYTLITGAAGGALAANIEWRITNSGNSILLGRPQFELGLSAGVGFSSSYIPTTTAVATRSADIPIITTAAAPWYNQTEGTFVVRFSYTEASSVLAPNTRFALAVNDGTASNRHGIYNRSGGVAQSGLTTTAGSTTAAPGAGTSLEPNVVAIAAYSYKENDFHFAFNGALGTPDDLGPVPTNITRLVIGGTGLANTALFGCIERIDYYPVKVTPAQLQQLSLG